MIDRCKARRKTVIRLTAEVSLTCWFRLAPRLMPRQTVGGINFQKTKRMAIPSGLLSQIVCDPGLLFQFFGILFGVVLGLGTLGAIWPPALNLTGIWISILIYFWIPFLLFCRFYFQGFFVLCPDICFSTFMENVCVWGANGQLRRCLARCFTSQS